VVEKAAFSWQGGKGTGMGQVKGIKDKWEVLE